MSVFNHFNGFKLYLMATAVAAEGGDRGCCLRQCIQAAAPQLLRISSSPYPIFISHRIPCGPITTMSYDNVQCVHTQANCTADAHVYTL